MIRAHDSRGSFTQASGQFADAPSSSVISQRELSYLEADQDAPSLNDSGPPPNRLPPLRGALAEARAGSSFNVMDELEAQSDIDDSSSSGFFSENDDDDQDSLFIEPKQTALYRYEMDGIVVYDMNSKTKEMARQEPLPFVPFEGEINSTRRKVSDEQNPLSLAGEFDVARQDTELKSEEEDEAAELKSIDSFEEAPPTKKDFLEDNDRILYNGLPKFPKKRPYVIQYTLGVPNDDAILQFDSKFQNGNLAKAVKVGPFEYNLLLSNDFNTKGHTQWFYFKVVSKLPRGQVIKFNIVNLTKPTSLYSYGMKPCVYSQNRKLATGDEWHRDCFAITYTQNKISRGIPKEGKEIPEWAKYFYTISFSYRFHYDRDTVYFAHSIPYTFRRLNEFIENIRKKKSIQSYLRVNALCNSLAGNKCFMMTITEDVDSYITYDDQRRVYEKSHAARKLLRNRAEKLKRAAKAREAALGKRKKKLAGPVAQPPTQGQGQGGENDDTPKEPLEQIMFRMAMKHEHKKGIILSGRVHPGEPQASWVLQGTIQFLLSNQEEARILRRNFVFKILPMLNPDGVIYGNTRCSLLGVDLNRKWIMPNKYLHPTIYYCKQLVRNFCEERQVTLFCDYHGHSRKMNAFTYGCTYKNTDFDGFKQNSVLRLFPLLLSQASPSFSFKDCHFRLEKCKQATARIVVFKEFEIMNSFTLEATFYGADSFGLSTDDPIRKRSLEIEKLKRQREQLRRAKAGSPRITLSPAKRDISKSKFDKTPQQHLNQSKDSKEKQEIQNQQEEEENEQQDESGEQNDMKPEEEDDEESLAIGSHMTERDYLRLGKDVCHTVLQFLPVRNYRRKLQLCLQRIAQVLHQEYINCPFVLSSSNKKRKLTEPRGSTDKEEEQKEGGDQIVVNEQDLGYFSDEEGGSPEHEGSSPERSPFKERRKSKDPMHGINELLQQRKTQAIEYRKQRGQKAESSEDSLSDTTSSDSEESVREFICLKARQSKKRSKIKDLMNRKKAYKPKKPEKEAKAPPPQQQAEMNITKQSEPEASPKRKVTPSEPTSHPSGHAQSHPAPQPPQPQHSSTHHHQISRKKSNNSHKAPAPSAIYLKRQKTDFLSRLTKVVREDRYANIDDSNNPTVREGLPNLDLVPIIIDSKQSSHSIYIKNRTKSSQPVPQTVPLEQPSEEESRNREEAKRPVNIQSMLKISRMNIVQKHSLPTAALPAPYNSLNKSYQNPASASRQHRVNPPASPERTGPLMIVGSSGQPTGNNIRFLHRGSKQKLPNTRDSTEEPQDTGSRANYHLAQLKREQEKMRQERKKGGLILVSNELTDLAQERVLNTRDSYGSKLRERKDESMPDSANREPGQLHSLKIDARSSLKKENSEQPKSGSRTNSKIKKRTSRKKIYAQRKPHPHAQPPDISSIETEKAADRKTPTQWRLEVEIRRHEQELLEFLNFNSSFASKSNNRLAQIPYRREHRIAGPPPGSSCSQQDCVSPVEEPYYQSRSRHKGLPVQSVQMGGTFQNKRYSNTVIRGAHIESTTQGEVFKTPSTLNSSMVNKSVNMGHLEAAGVGGGGVRFPSPGYGTRPRQFYQSSNISSQQQSVQQTIEDIHLAQKAQMQKFIQTSEDRALRSKRLAFEEKQEQFHLKWK